MSSLIEGRSTSSAARAEKRAARAPQSGRFLGIYAWFQSWCTSVRGASRPRAAAPVHNPHNFTGLLSRVNTVHSSDPACVPRNPAEWVCEYAPVLSFCGTAREARPGVGRAARVFDAGLAVIPAQGRVLVMWGAWGTVGLAAHDREPRPRGTRARYRGRERQRISTRARSVTNQ